MSGNFEAITIDQAREEIGESELEFSHYYKFSFTFQHVSSGIFISSGGYAEAIYRSDVDANMTIDKILSELGDEHLYVSKFVASGGAS